jgi:hypothetical protein
VVVDDLDIVGISLLPTKADSPLIVDPDTVLTFPSKLTAELATEYLLGLRQRKDRVTCSDHMPEGV